jgi:serralysin
VLVAAGQATYSTTFQEGPVHRAGDFSGITVDPVTGTSFWAANEYATAPAPNNWGTWIANFTVTGAFFAVGGAPGRVQILRTSDNSVAADFAPYGPAYTDGVNVALGDVNGDGVADIITGAADGNPHVKVYDGKALATGTFNSTNPDASLLVSFFAYGIGFNVGVNVAAGEVLKDGYADIVTGADAGNPDVRVFSGKDIANHAFDPTGNSLLAQWFPYALQFNVGANVAVGDINNDGYADIVTGATTGNPDVRVYNGKDIADRIFDPAGASQLAQFFPYGLGFGIGAFVAVGDINGDGYGDIITGATAGNSDVRIFNGKDIANHAFDSGHPEASQLGQFFAYQLEFFVGAAVAAEDFEGNGHFDILTGAAQGAPNYRVVRGNATGIEPPALNGLEGIPSDMQGGIAVGA